MTKSSPISLANIEYLSRYKNIYIALFKPSFERLSQAVEELLGDKPVTVIFVENEYIQNLNRQYRKVDQPTDVLSFAIDDENNEVYISPSYIFKNYRGTKFREEILRMIIHGILHIYGYDHEGKFDGTNTESEKMFSIQEEILTKVLGKK